MTVELVIANLDAELHWARRAGQSVRDLPHRVRKRISSYGLLLQALWPNARRIWTPDEVQGRPSVPGLPPPCETRQGPLREQDLSSTRCWAMASPWFGDEERLDAAMRVNDRRFAHRLAVELDVAIPGSAVVTTWHELTDCIEAHDRWVLKTPYGTAGRGFVHGCRSEFNEPHGARQAARLLEAHSRLLFQPWLERTADLGVVVTPDGVVRHHRILSSASGRFEGIRIEPRPSVHTRSLCDLAGRVGQRLAREGYRGAFGIDAFVDAHSHLFPLCEINGRHTFGHVAHALVDLVAAPKWGRDAVIELRFGDRPRRAAEGDVIPLLGHATGVHAWLVRS